MTPYVGGEIKTREKFQYGRFVTRMRVPQMPKGTVASFFTYWNGPGWKEGEWNEIDLELVPSISNTQVSTNLIYGTGRGHSESHKYEASPQHDQWTTHQVDWTPDYIRWYVNGTLIRESLPKDKGVSTMDKEQVLMMNFWTPTWSPWGDGLDNSSMPWTADYDFVETYKYNHATKKFSLNWRDDFNSLIADRWLVSDNWNFGGSSTTFMKKQVYTDKGALHLKLERGLIHMDDLLDEM